MTPLILNGVHSLALKRARDHKTVPAKGYKVRWGSNESGRETGIGTVKARIWQTMGEKKKEMDRGKENPLSKVRTTRHRACL